MAGGNKRRAGQSRAGVLLFLVLLGAALILRFGQSEPLRQARETLQDVAELQLDTGQYEQALETLGRGFVRITEPEGQLAAFSRRLLGLRQHTGATEKAP